MKNTIRCISYFFRPKILVIIAIMGFASLHLHFKAEYPATADTPIRTAQNFTIPSCAVDLQTLARSNEINNLLYVLFASSTTLDLALNLIQSMKHQNINNFIIISLDSSSATILKTHLLPCYQFFGYRSKEQEDYTRLYYALEVLQLGYDIFIVHEDTVFLKDPFRTPSLTNYLQSDYEYVIEDFGGNGTEEGIGFFFMKSSPNTIQYLQRVNLFSIRQTTRTLQQVWNVQANIVNPKRTFFPKNTVLSANMFFPPSSNVDKIGTSSCYFNACRICGGYSR